MTRFPNARGFVLQYVCDNEVDPTPSVVDIRRMDGGGAASGSSFRLLVRPHATTPEAERELQPIVTPRAVLAYAGRVDNRKEIADRLGQPQLLAGGDGGLLAAAYAAWGRTFPAKVLGEFTVVVVDRATGQMVAARDSLGIGRLYRYDAPGSVWVASSLELLLDALPSRPDLDREALAEYFASGGLLTSGRTIYARLRELPAAHVLTQTGGTAHVERYWQPDPERRSECTSAAGYDEAFRALLFDAVRAALRSNTVVWGDLSGGLDSSTVTGAAAVLAAAGEGPAHGLGAFSLYGSRTTALDERAYQDAFLAVHPLDHYALDNDEYPSFSLEEPPSCHPSKAILYRPIWHAAGALFAAHGAGTRLTGRGGDNIFCGDGFPPLHLSELARGLHWRRWLAETRAWARQGERSVWNLTWECSRGALTDLRAGEDNGELPTWLTADFRDAARAAEAAPWRSGERLYASAARELQYRSIVQTAAVARYILVGDERNPLLYRPLVEFMLTVPWEHLIQPTRNRVIQRRATAALLPDRIRERTTKATGTGLLLRSMGEHWSTVQPLTLGRRLAELDLVDPSKFQSACERMRHGLLNNHLRYLAAGLSLEMWLRANHDRSAPAARVDDPSVRLFAGAVA